MATVLNLEMDKDLEAQKRLYMGLDLSTQRLKAVIVDNNLLPIYQASVLFDSDIPEYRTHGGVIQDKSHPSIITAPTLLWVKALDILMDQLIVGGVEFSKICALSGAAQQHGSVYWHEGAGKRLGSLDSSHFLHHLLNSSFFSVQNSPTWMDSSTSMHCKLLEDAVGGPSSMASITGSRAYERFTGSHISKLNHLKPDVYHHTERISLVSSFLCSLFLGGIAPIDIADASGMNLLNIKTKKWDEKLLHAAAPNLAEKLGEPVPSYTVVGTVSSYFVERWGFNPECKVVAFTGDNIASLMGMRLTRGWLAVSLGTSDTLFCWLDEPRVTLQGHIFCNPIDPNSYVALLCFKNGSLTRERIRDNYAEGSWTLFNQLLESTPRGNFGHIGLYYDAQEIMPFLTGNFRFNKAGERVKKFSGLEIEVRAVIEGQFIAKRAHAEDMGFSLGPQTKLLVTGGASRNKAIVQVLSDVFNAPVYVQNSPSSAMLGAAYQAKHGLFRHKYSYEQITSCLPKPVLLCEPYKDAPEIYDRMVTRYRDIIRVLEEEEQQNMGLLEP